MGEDALHQRDAGRSEDQTQEAGVSGRALERGFSNNSLVSSADMSQDGLGEAAASRRTCCGRKAWLYPELPWGAPPETDTTHMRGASFLAVWEMVTFLCCLYVAVSVPYNVTFAEKQGNIQLQKGEVPPDDCVFLNLHEFPPMKFYMSLADLFVDFIFYIDIVLNFHCACWEISTRLPPGVPGHSKTPQWVMIDDLVDIRAAARRGRGEPRRRARNCEQQHDDSDEPALLHPTSSRYSLSTTVAASMSFRPFSCLRRRERFMSRSISSAS